MKVALFHPWIYLKSGLERTVLELARLSRHEWTLYTSHYDAEGTYPELKQQRVVEIDRVSVQRSYGAVLGASARIARTRLPDDGAGVVVVCCEGVGSFVTLRNANRPLLNLCFTPLRAVYDAEYRRRHLERQGAKRPLALLMEAGFRLVDRWLWKRYDEVVCISDAVKERVVDGGLWPADRLPVYYPGIHAESIRPSDVFEPFFFLPGRIMWTKNIELGIEAFQRFRRAQGGPWQLVIAGMVDAKSAEYHARLLAMIGDDPSIRFHIGPSDAEMAGYYERCSAMLFTPFNEDLGLTPMEAMAKGKPVVAVDAGGPREIVAHGVTGLRAPAEPQAFAEAMAQLVADPERLRAMGRAGAERVQRYTWQRFVGEMDDLIDRMAAGR
jgi:glycosyltransferase involved in cell wall biosynthesis